MTYPSIIGLNGVARAGKDTVAEVLHQVYGYEIKSFSDILNKALIALNPDIVGIPVADLRLPRYADVIEDYGYEAAKEFPAIRRLLQRMGTEVGRNLLGADIWVNALFKDRTPEERWVITNVRFPNEAEAVWKREGVVWEIMRPGFKPALGHVSDTALDSIRKDAYIHNDGTIGELALRVVDIMDRGNEIKAGLQAAFNGGIREG